MLRVLSLGAGVQSSAILMMSEAGELPQLDAAVFADTGDETDATYNWLKWLVRNCMTPILVGTRGYSIEGHVTPRIRWGKRLDSPPFFVATESTPSPINRDCTREWKIKVVEAVVKQEILGLKKGGRWPTEPTVEQWLGISSDEIRRMANSTAAWSRMWHPLIETEWNGKRYGWRQPTISRKGCERWMEEHGYPVPPESSCWHCPYHDNAKWRWLRDNEPHNWQRAIGYDHMIRSGPNGVIHGMNEQAYLHRSLQPLDEVDLGEDDSDAPLFSCGVCNT